MPPRTRHEPARTATWTAHERGLVKAHLPGLLGTARAYVGDAAAEGLVRDALRSAAADPADGDDPAGWLHAHLWASLERRGGHADGGAASAGCPGARRDALMALPARSRAAVTLADIEGLSYAQLARALDTSVEAASALLHDTRRRLLPALDGPRRPRGSTGG